MDNWLTKIYKQLPYPARSLVVNARGYQLLRWRYGHESEALIEEALARDAWTVEQWRCYQEEQLSRILHHAATKIPYYRQQWQQRRRSGDRGSWELLNNWPVLKKDALRATPEAFVADDLNQRKLVKEQTSGTTGMPLTLWRSRQSYLLNYALFEARVHRWNGVSIKSPWMHLGGQVVTPYDTIRPPFWVWSKGLKMLYMSTYHIAPQNVNAYAQAIADYGVQHILGYSSSLNALAYLMEQAGIEIPTMQVVVCDSEPLFGYQRERITHVFNCPCRSTYGMSEIVAEASECNDGTMHLWPEVGLVEVLHDVEDTPVPRRQVGRLICTGFLNKEMPLIRYQVGDRGALGSERVICKCGRHLPTLFKIEGRNNDVIITPDGRYVWWINPVFYGLKLMEAQVVQREANSLSIRFVPAPGFTESEVEEMKRRLQQRVGNMQFEFQQVTAIERGPRGKFQAVVSLLR